ncbi:MAG: NAD(P)-dependent oxidoreductase [Pseudomonadales bacterium]|nr:NAD(P)-dependent oxidoreductase [Pseudomonadales bacterium]NRA16541.1 NAD(P)-dependent oxidoreductase [Oceanospirillaceae bacterium]
MSSLQGKTLFITGASRGIGLAIAKKAALDGANIVIAAKSITAHPTLPGTIYSAAEEIQGLGGKALALQVDIRDERQITAAVVEAVKTFGGIDICINNASAISLTDTENTSLKRFDLMHQVNTRGTYAVSQACLPQLLKADNPHILNLAPPLNMDPKWFKNHGAYTIAKYGMSLCVLGMAAEYADRGVAVNALWPKTVIYTAALAALGDLVNKENCRTPQIVADSAYCILTRDARDCSGNFFIDEEVLLQAGVSDFDQYAVVPGKPLLPDLFL